MYYMGFQFFFFWVFLCYLKKNRLCTNAEISKQVVELQGVNQLVRLCKEERERNFNDDILVACLVNEFKR